MVARYSKMTRNGQITIPVQFRRELGIDEGDSVAFERKGDFLVVRLAGSATERTRGALAKYASLSPLTEQEQNEVFAQAIVDDYVESEARSR